jgi:DNA repair exonuclease SbcCD ATPase subunit
VAAQLAEAKRQIEEQQLSGLDDSERQQREFERRQQQWQGEVDAWRQQQAVQEWGAYWSQFVAEPDTIKAMNDPIQMGHTVVTDLSAQLRKAQAEVAALKKAAATPATGPPVTTGAQGTASSRSLFSMSKEDREALMRRARMGQLKDSDIPPLK